MVPHDGCRVVRRLDPDDVGAELRELANRGGARSCHRQVDDLDAREHSCHVRLLVVVPDAILLPEHGAA